MPMVIIKGVHYSTSKHFQSVHVLTCRKTQQQYLSHTQQYTANRIINSHCNSLCNLKVTNSSSLHQRHQLRTIQDWVDKVGSAESTAATTAVRREGRSLVPIQPPGSHHCASTVRRRSFNVLFCMLLHTMPVL